MSGMVVDDTPRARDADGVIVVVRWLGVAFAIVQTATYYRPFPGSVEAVAWGINGAYALAAVALTAWFLRLRSLEPPPALERGRARFAAASLATDVLAASAMTWVYAFDPETAIFAVLYLAAIEGAFRYGMRGAMYTMVVVSLGYAAREVWASRVWGTDPLPASVSFRMGVGFLIAAIAGGMAERYEREHRRLKQAIDRERAAAAALRSLDELRSTFLAAVSHELRTPLTSILGFSLTLQERDELDPPSRAMLDHVVAESRTLERLLEDLLDIERMGRGSVSIDRQPTDVATIGRRLAERIADREQRRIDVDLLGDVHGVVDGPKVERIIDNLLGNAVKYTEHPSAVLLHLERRIDGLMISVDDDGPGVPADMRTSIFEPFERGSLTSLHQPGTGIGLSLVDRFARLHGGRAWVEDSATRRGASFRVFLPDGPTGISKATIVGEPWGPGVA
ncbi:MAG: Chemotaxis protein methyltransferase CheR [Thermoleophilia bacterium]|nr:Chemotaxis protein methyltransferase CheR [Thermoleophilia bacterium]